MSSYETAQQAQRRGELVRAKANLRMCAAACPAALTADCERWLVDVQRSIASVTITARDASGKAVVARLVVDGTEQPLAQVLELDPGTHRIEITSAGFAPVSTSIESRAGQSDSRAFTLRALPPARPQGEARPSIVGPVLLGGAGLLTLVAAGALTLVGHLDVSEMRDTCAPDCDRERVDRVEQLWTAAGILAGVGGATLIASGTWLGVTLSPPTAAGSSTRASFNLGFDF